MAESKILGKKVKTMYKLSISSKLSNNNNKNGAREEENIRDYIF